MKILAWMMTRMILARLLLILFGISIFAVTLDVVTFAEDILELKDNDTTAILTYSMLRMPAALSTYLPTSALLAILLTFSELSHRNELTAVWGTGMSSWRIIVSLIPLGLFLGCIHFMINDQAIPRVTPILHEWGIGDYAKKRLKLGERDPLWMRAGNDIIRAAGANPRSSLLNDLVIFRRDDKGLLIEQIFAERADLVGSRWQLTNAIVYYRSNLPPNRLDRMIYSGPMRPAASGARSGDPEEMSSSTLGYFIANKGFGVRPAYVYETWWNKRMTLPVATLLMMAICVPLASRFRRGGGIGIFFALGVALGFSFFLFDGITLTLGEIGIVSPSMAAWAPIFAFSAVGATLVFRAETL